MLIVDGDLFSTDCEIIAHQVNCTGIMGSGVARQIKLKYPKAYEVYHDQCTGKYNGIIGDPWLLGTTNVVDCGDKHIANMFSQYYYNSYKGRFLPQIEKSYVHRDKDYLNELGYNPVKIKSYEGRFTDYEAFYCSLVSLREVMDTDTRLTSVAFPYNIGCDRGGGNWNIIRTMIEEVLKNFEVKIYRL